MNYFGPFVLVLMAVVGAAFFLLVPTVLVLLGRKLLTGRSAGKHGRDWLLSIFIAPLIIVAFTGSYFYAANKGIDEHTVIKWMNIVIAAVFVFGSAVRRFWNVRRKWTFWAGLSVLVIGHFALLSRLRWEQANYFWLILVVGLPELAVVFFLLRLAFNPKQPRTANEVAGIIERFLTNSRLYPQEWNDFVECGERDSKLDKYRKRCYELDPMVNCPGPQDPKAIAELQNMVEELRQLQVQTEKGSQ
jgi:hypothetical protein